MLISTMRRAIRTLWTDDPVRDADMYFRDDRPILGVCEECGLEIHGQNEDYYEDDAYVFDGGEFVCGDCLRAYCNQHFRI